MKKIVPMYPFCSPGNVHLPVKVAAASPVLPPSEFPMIHKYMSEGWQPELDAHGPDVNKYRKLPGATQQIEVNKNSFTFHSQDLLNGGNMKYSRFPKCKMRKKFRRYYQHPSPDLKHYTSPDIEIIKPENEKKRDLQCNICCLTFRFGSSFCSHLKGERHKSCEKLLKNFYLKYKNVHV